MKYFTYTNVRFQYSSTFTKHTKTKALGEHGPLPNRILSRSRVGIRGLQISTPDLDPNDIQNLLQTSSSDICDKIVMNIRSVYPET